MECNVGIAMPFAPSPSLITILKRVVCSPSKIRMVYGIAIPTFTSFYLDGSERMFSEFRREFLETRLDEARAKLDAVGSRKLVELCSSNLPAHNS